ncbi:hypothetical protein ANN_26831 [Periplaneta americana]|uniref:Uncharacterized protein n=1 Tax=Periplaneta americana TaxID=6978 RepID=A0ABQ8RZ58_PERAM|nr:hypothetical protein ANN_26831 [Periplaneta americana]
MWFVIPAFDWNVLLPRDTCRCAVSRNASDINFTCHPRIHGDEDFYLQQDGALAHHHRDVMAYLDETLPSGLRQTGRSFQTPYKEHITAITKLQNTSTYAEHITKANHTHRDIITDMEILHIQPKSQKLNTLEQYEIYRHTKTHPNDILNTQLNFKTHKLFDSTLRTHPYRKQDAPNQQRPVLKMTQNRSKHVEKGISLEATGIGLGSVVGIALAFCARDCGFDSSPSRWHLSVFKCDRLMSVDLLACKRTLRNKIPAQRRR